jgi:hypothetical protein
MTRTVIGSLALLALAGNVACASSSDHKPVLSGGGDDAGGGPTRVVTFGSDASSDAIAASDGSVDAGIDGTLAVTDGGACTTLTATSFVTESSVPSAPPPLTAGSVEPGTYVLTALNKYVGVGGSSSSPPAVEARVLQIDTGTYAQVWLTEGPDGGVGNTDISSGTYQVKSKAFTLTSTCGAPQITVGYSVVGSTLHLLFGDEEYVLTKM